MIMQSRTVSYSAPTSNQLGNWTTFVSSFPVTDYCKQSNQTKPMTTSTQNLLTIAEVLHAAGKEVKIRRLPTAQGTKANRYADRIRGGSSRVRTGAGSRSVNQSTKATAMGDVL